MRRRDSKMAIALLVGAATVGLSLFAAVAWRAFNVRPADQAEALQQFNAIRARLPRTMPLVRRDESGHFRRQREPSARGGPAPTRLQVLAYRASEERLVEADVPLWFFRVKGPAVAFALRGTNFDLESLGLTAADLVDAGPGIVLDETRGNGDRVLAWTQ
jgi:hypothetical protein